MATVLELGSLVWNKSMSLRGEVVGIQIILQWKSYKVKWENGTTGWYNRDVLRTS